MGLASAECMHHRSNNYCVTSSSALHSMQTTLETHTNIVPASVLTVDIRVVRGLFFFMFLGTKDLEKQYYKDW